MKSFCSLFVVWSVNCCFFLSAECLAQQSANQDMSRLEKKIAKKWVGAGPCDGTLKLKPDGKYARKYYGPGGISSAGTWDIDWDQLPPVLVLRCTSSNVNERIMQTYKWRIIKLTENELQLNYAEDARRVKYSPVK